MTDAFLMSGAGNDFLALAEPEELPSEQIIRGWCRRGVSVGADGLFVLTREADHVRMDYWNADGRAADFCLNGTRCAARLAFELGWAEGSVTIATGAGPLAARWAGTNTVAVELAPPRLPPREFTLEDGDRLWEGFYVLTGVPHFVVPQAGDMADAPLARGPWLRSHPAFGPAGTNVDFVRFAEPHRLELRTFERGVEAETLACGTGVMAAVITGLLTRRCRLPVVALTRGGFELTVDGDVAESMLPTQWSLAGDARLLARLSLTPEAAALPTAPAW